jgi:general secretion pathway protein A
LEKREHSVAESAGHSADLAAVSSALVRMAEALERIDDRLATIFPDEHVPRKESVGVPDNVKPLSPNRK